MATWVGTCEVTEACHQAAVPKGVHGNTGDEKTCGEKCLPSKLEGYVGLRAAK